MIDENWQFVCPHCLCELGVVQPCPRCGAEYSTRDGIHRFLLPVRFAEIQPFLTQYRLVREKDGYRSRSPDYYRSLPFVDRRDPQTDVWHVRAESFRNLCRWMGSVFGKRSLRILDLGAGNCWLSHRLSAAGHRLAAVDWLDDVEDGLSAGAFYPVRFTRVQADFDQLPVAPGQFDLVIFNASLHYSPNVSGTLRRARQMLKRGGSVAVMDSPTFRSEEAGRRMVAELAGRLRAEYGLQTVVQQGVAFLTEKVLLDAGEQLWLRFRFIPSRGRLGWAARRLAARVRLGREAARFGVWVGVKYEFSRVD